MIGPTSPIIVCRSHPFFLPRLPRHPRRRSNPVSTTETLPALPQPVRLTRRLMGQELLIVLGLSLGASGVSALISFAGSLTANKSLKSQQATLNGSITPGRPWLDLTWHLFDIT